MQAPNKNGGKMFRYRNIMDSPTPTPIDSPPNRKLPTTVLFVTQLLDDLHLNDK